MALSPLMAMDHASLSLDERLEKAKHLPILKDSTFYLDNPKQSFVRTLNHKEECNLINLDQSQWSQAVLISNYADNVAVSHGHVLDIPMDILDTKAFPETIQKILNLNIIFSIVDQDPPPQDKKTPHLRTHLKVFADMIKTPREENRSVNATVFNAQGNVLMVENNAPVQLHGNGVKSPDNMKWDASLIDWEQGQIFYSLVQNQSLGILTQHVVRKASESISSVPSKEALENLDDYLTYLLERGDRPHTLFEETLLENIVG